MPERACANLQACVDLIGSFPASTSSATHSPEDMANLAAAYITLAFAGWCATMATAGGTCSLKPGQDCSGNDISDAPSASPQACCDACAATAGCGAFTYNDYNAQGQQQGTCYLKSACPSSIGCGTCTAGVSAPPASPTPPPVPPTPSPAVCPASPACSANPPPAFPDPTVKTSVRAPTTEQAYMQTHWPGYLHGVSVGGAFVIENWMFSRPGKPDAELNDATLHLRSGESFDNLAWSSAMLADTARSARFGSANATANSTANVSRAFATMDCHLRKYVGDAELDALAEFGYNALRLPVGYWLFDDPDLYPADTWQVPPRVPPTSSGNGAGNGNVSWPGYGVNPDGFVTPGTRPLSDMIVRAHNRNMRAPNTWNGAARDGVSGGHANLRSKTDPKTWMEVAKTIALNRVVPWIKHIDKFAPGTVIGFETVNEPDIGNTDASTDQVRCLTVDLASELRACLGAELADQVSVVLSNAARNYPTSAIAADYATDKYSGLRAGVITDIHHYFNWGGCQDGGSIGMSCVCGCGLPGQRNDDGDWKAYSDAGLFDDGWRFIVGEWSVALGPAHSCNPGGGPAAAQASAMWLAQKWSYLSLHAAYAGKAAAPGAGKGNGTRSSFAGDFFWTARMGYDWDPSPEVCAGSTSTSGYEPFTAWDWSMLRLIELGLIKPISQLGVGGAGWTPDNIASQQAAVCQDTFRVNC
eukprot:g1577.t1